MPRFSDHSSRWVLFLFLGLGMGTQTLAQVPEYQDRIRKTTRDILGQPEFGLFPRLKPGEPARGIVRRGSGASVPRLQSSTGRLPEPGNEMGQPGNQGGGGQGAANGGGPERRIANRFPQEMPGNPPRRAKGNPENPQDALGKKDDLFPEAKNLGGIENQDFKPQNPPKQNDLNNANPQADNPANNGAANPANPPQVNPNPPQPPPNGNPPNAGPDNRGAANPGQRDNGVNQNNNNALPAPRPRENTTSEEELFSPRTSAETSGFARVVGTLFHVLAWAILAVICGLIIWLIGKAILEFERPASFSFANADTGSALDLEPSRAPGELPADVYVNRAMQLAERGLFREAVVQLLLGAMSRVERAGWVRFRQGMTVRDYLRDVHQHQAAYQGMRSIVRVFEPLTFGRREPTQEHFDRSLRGYESGFGVD